MRGRKPRNLTEDFFNYIHENVGGETRKDLTIQELADAFHCSIATAHKYLMILKEEGRINYNKWSISDANVRNEGIPVVGTVACGTPVFAEQNIEEYIQTPVRLDHPKEYFFLRANGESMIDAGINDGDLVLVHKQDTAEPGDIVVALLWDGVTLKRYYPDMQKKMIRLHPENKMLDDIIVDECKVQGVAKNVWRTIK